MARLSISNSFSRPPPVDSNVQINLDRMLARLQKTLVTPTPEFEARLRASSYEREKVATNIQAAQTLLIQLELQSQTMKILPKKVETQTALVNKRIQLKKLTDILDEYNEFAERQQPQLDDDSSEGEDLLGEDTPSASEETDSHPSHADPESAIPSPTRPEHESPPPRIPPTTTMSTHPPEPPAPTPEPESILRNRNTNARDELFTHSTTTTSMSTATAEQIQDREREAQEELSHSLLNMAVALKQSSRAFGVSLEQSNIVLDSAVKGLDKNELGLEAATRKMGLLRGFTEGRGWLGRMIMYAWIFGLMVIAILVVFVMPKLRF